MLRVPLAELCAGERVLPEEAARYVVRVHRLREGGRFVAFDPESATEAEAELVSSRREGTRCRIFEPVSSTRLPRSDVTLLTALGKHDKPDHVIREGTALGVSRIVLLESSRVVVRLGERGPSRRARFRTIAVEAARQSGRGDIPQIEGPLPLHDALSRTDGRDALRLLLEPRAPSLWEILSSWRRDQALALLVGPEGGFSEGERKAALDAGFVAASLGAFVLRTETAAVAALGAIAARW